MQENTKSFTRQIFFRDLCSNAQRHFYNFRDFVINTIKSKSLFLANNIINIYIIPTKLTCCPCWFWFVGVTDEYKSCDAGPG